MSRHDEQRALGGVADHGVRGGGAVRGRRPSAVGRASFALRLPAPRGPGRRLTLREARVVAEGRHERQVAEERGVRRERRGGLLGRAAFEVRAQRYAHDAHAVLGEGAGLVRADDGGAAKRLHGGQAPHERLVPRHALHAQRHDDGGGGGKALGDDGDGQRHGQQQKRHERPAVGQADGHHGQRRRHAHDGEQLAERGQLALERRVQLLVVLQKPRDLGRPRCPFPWLSPRPARVRP